MKMFSSVTKRTFAAFLAVLMIVSAAVFVFAESAPKTVTAGSLVADYYGHNEGEKGILGSGLVKGDIEYVYTAPDDSQFPVIIDSSKKTLFAPDMTLGENEWKVTDSKIKYKITHGEASSVIAHDGQTPFMYDGDEYSIIVDYTLFIPVDTAVQSMFINGPYYIIRGIQNIEDVKENKDTLKLIGGYASELSQISSYVTDLPEVTAAIDSLIDQNNKNEGSLDLYLMLQEYEEYPSRVQYLFDHGAEFSAKAAETYSDLNALYSISEDEKFVSMLNAYALLNPSSDVPEKINTALARVKTLLDAMKEAIKEENWAVLSPENNILKDDISSTEYKTLDGLVDKGLGAEYHEAVIAERLPAQVVRIERSVGKQHDHEFGEWVTVTEPTCTEGSEKTRFCAICGESESVPIPALGHDFGKDGKADKCARCGAANPGAPTVSFSDVGPTDYFAPAVDWAVKNNVTAGTGGGKFSPASGCTRGQVVTFLWRAVGSPEPASDVNPFEDVKTEDYFFKAVLWAVEKEITLGTSKTKFSPDATCTRGQIVTFLYRFEGSPEFTKGDNPFTDVSESDYFFNAVLWAVGKGITVGTTPTTFAPASTCTRGQIVTFLYRDMRK